MFLSARRCAGPRNSPNMQHTRETSGLASTTTVYSRHPYVSSRSSEKRSVIDPMSSRPYGASETAFSSVFENNPPQGQSSKKHTPTHPSPFLHAHTPRSIRGLLFHLKQRIYHRHPLTSRGNKYCYFLFVYFDSAGQVGSNGGSSSSNSSSSRARRRPRSDAPTQAGKGGMLLAPPPLPGVTYKGGLLSASPPPPPVSPQAAGTSTPETAAAEETPTAAVTAGVAPPTVTSPTSKEAEEPPDSSRGTAAEVDTGRAASAGGVHGDGGGGGGDGDDTNDDDDGWGEFESA